MCGRLFQHVLREELRALYGLPGTIPHLDLQPRYNGAPTREFVLCRLDAYGTRSLAQLRWGLVPGWARDTRIGARLVNARSETVHGKPAFRSAFRSRRCLVPANGWFEWRGGGPAAGRQPFFLALENGAPVSFAALWEPWSGNGRRLETFTIITTVAAPALSEIHHRQPAVVDPDDFADWLDPDTPVDALREIVRTPHEGPYAVRPVGDRVNRVSNDTPDILEPPDAPEPPVQSTLF